MSRAGESGSTPGREAAGCQVHTSRVSRNLCLMALLTRKELNTIQGSCVACHFMPCLKQHFDNKVLLLDFLPKAGFYFSCHCSLLLQKQLFQLYTHFYPSLCTAGSWQILFWEMDLFQLCHSKKGPKLLFNFYLPEGQLQANYLNKLHWNNVIII